MNKHQQPKTMLLPLFDNKFQEIIYRIILHQDLNKKLKNQLLDKIRILVLLYFLFSYAYLF
ncbi:hypothetical protein BACCOP_03105 [Phocaeicola coprocola DSM 17136]|uniref:Uncharacterized protein n=1 Tax=Phocaeicola coprocola DSM 17136 TaxID=470145 RepID=B3JMG6_9BACT|nr:hypothetical protein BACCOP_03105 [Phocaeicola coprocola DSM 17136]